MTFFQKAIIQEIKENNANSDYLNKYNRGLKFEKMNAYKKNGLNTYTVCSSGECLVRYEVICKFKPETKWDNDIVIYQVNVYSDGTMSVYFDGTK